MNARRVAAAWLLVGVACTTSAPPPAPTRAEPTDAGTTPCPDFVLERNGGGCADRVEVDGAPYGVVCVAVPEVLLDVSLDARWGGRQVRAIAAVPVSHAVAVTAASRECGAFALAIRDDLPQNTREAIIAEVRAAATLPPDP